MMPTLNLHGDVLLIDKTFNLLPWRVFRTGDIVVARHPTNANQFICKRITAVAGEELAQGGKVCPPGRVWLEGDNKSCSFDSRDYGPVPEGLLVGKVAMRLWPLRSLGRP